MYLLDKLIRIDCLVKLVGGSVATLILVLFCYGV